MIFQLICDLLFGLIKFIVSLLPTSIILPEWYSQAQALIDKALILFPADVLKTVIGNVTFWMTVQFAWSIIEWVYKKIPGVD